MKIKPINTQKTENDHAHQVLLTTLADTHNIPDRPPLSVPFACEVPRQVRNSSFQFMSLFLRIISI